MKMIKTSYLSLFILFLIIVMISTISASLAWISIEGSKDVTLNPGTFVISTNVKEKVDDTLINLTPLDGVFTLNGLSSENNEHAEAILGVENNNPLIQNLVISIDLSAQIPGYMRVKLQDEWIVTRKYINFDRESTEVVFQDQSTSAFYILADGWMYDENTNYFYYYNLIEQGTNTEIEFITAGTSYGSNLSSYYVETCEVNISISVQVVQANRYEALWGISSIPQPTPGDLTGGE